MCYNRKQQQELSQACTFCADNTSRMNRQCYTCDKWYCLKCFCEWTCNNPTKVEQNWNNPIYETKGTLYW